MEWSGVEWSGFEFELELVLELELGLWVWIWIWVVYQSWNGSFLGATCEAVDMEVTTKNKASAMS